MSQSMTRSRRVSAKQLRRVSNRKSQSPTTADRGRTPTDRLLASLVNQLRTAYAQPAIDLRSHPAPPHLRLQLLIPTGFSSPTAPPIGHHLAQSLHQQRAILLANHIRHVNLTVTDRWGNPPLWQTTIVLTPPTTGPRSRSVSPREVRNLPPGPSPLVSPRDPSSPRLKLGKWVVLGCLDFLKSNGLLLTFLLCGWLYSAIALNSHSQVTRSQPQGTPQPLAQPASIPLPNSPRDSTANRTGASPESRPTLSPLEVAAKPDPLHFTVPEVFQGKTIYRVNPIRARKVIALTFSGGPWPDNTAQILAILQRYHVKATFFWDGQAVTDQPDLARQVVTYGHAIGHQPWSRSDAPSLNNPVAIAQRLDRGIAQDIERTAQVIQQTTGVTSTLFRPGQDAVNEALLLQAQRQQYTTILWSVDAGNEDSSDAIVERVLQDASAGAIVRMQDGGGDRVALIQALPQIITLLRRQGYQFLTVPDLLEQQTNLQTRPI